MYIPVLSSSFFQIKYLPDYADFILKHRLEEFIRIGIRFTADARFTLGKPFSVRSEDELIALNLTSTKVMLEALASNNVADHITHNEPNWIFHDFDIKPKAHFVPEDITVLFHVKRKVFAYFLDAYTKNVVEQKFIIAELDHYTTLEGIALYSLYLDKHPEHLIKANETLIFQNQLLMAADELTQIGTFLMDFKDKTKSFYTPQYLSILEKEDCADYNEFITAVCKRDRKKVEQGIASAILNGSPFEMIFTCKRNGKNKRIWMKALVEAEHSQPVILKGAIRSVAKKQNIRRGPEAGGRSIS